MREDCGTWVPHLQFGWQSPNLNPLDVRKPNLNPFDGRKLNLNPFDVGMPDGNSAHMNPDFNTVSTNVKMPAFASSAPPHSQFGHSNEPGGWFYCLPHFRQGFAPAPKVAAEGQPPADYVKDLRDKFSPYGELNSPQKQFLVIDQTGGQTTIVYSSKFGNPNECLASWHSKLHGSNYLRGNEPSFRRDLNLNHMTEPTLADKVHENQETGIESEMHEDTEEINALLYSDSDDYSTKDDDDDEVTSTGHSPSTMTTHDNHEIFRGVTAEVVASSDGKTKKRKLLDGYYDDKQFMDTAGSLNLNKSSAAAGGDDAESRCSGNVNKGSLLANKKMKKEKIGDVLSILQSLIPGRKDKDPIMLLNDAIRYLKSLKHKAQALGLDAV